MNDFSAVINYLATESDEDARISAVRKLADACETACELLSVSFHVASIPWSETAETTVDSILRDRAIAITDMAVTA